MVFVGWLRQRRVPGMEGAWQRRRRVCEMVRERWLGFAAE